jgi:Mn-dependent DtxR family transcriptional regulator
LEDIEVLRVIHNLWGPAVGTADVADELEVATQTADKYLHRLNDEGYVNTRKIGRVRVWWLSDNGKREITEPSD